MNDVSDFRLQSADSVCSLDDGVKFVVELLHGVGRLPVVVEDRSHFALQFGDAPVLIVVESNQFVNLNLTKSGTFLVSFIHWLLWDLLCL